jgi:hypothetical protein
LAPGRRSDARLPDLDDGRADESDETIALWMIPIRVNELEFLFTVAS